MTVRELIEELEEYPMDLPIVIDLKEISKIKLADMMYYLDKDETTYFYTPAVELG